MVSSKIAAILASTPSPTTSQIIHLYRALFRRLYYSPIDSQCYEILLTLQRQKFAKKTTNVAYHYAVGQKYLNLAYRAFVNAQQDSLQELLALAYKSADYRASSSPPWLRFFTATQNYNLQDFWPVKKVELLNPKALKDENSTQTQEVERQIRLAPSVFGNIRQEIDQGLIKIKNPHKKQPEIPDKVLSQAKESVEKVETLYKFLEKNSGKIHDKSLPKFSPLIPLHRTGLPLVYERQRNIVLTRINAIKKLMLQIPPVANLQLQENDQNLKERKQRIKHRSWLLSAHPERFSDITMSSASYKIHYKYYSEDFFSSQFKEFSGHQYYFDENDTPIYYSDQSVPIVKETLFNDMKS
ncbi:hypothetical protein DASC09_057530 [Saccharomycopsis crataegensis]|uniref:Mitochondrial zinc maintenance protein 1, mitochondrial n=1 Tax=Saccharomycopsis crataegensis TaxID=43959 RepID=A0AAV5QV77_9ASCO|nr:hypothetical protein DASC09_057530 [Saccharomycopsis crataegensis]